MQDHRTLAYVHVGEVPFHFGVRYGPFDTAKNSIFVHCSYIIFCLHRIYLEFYNKQFSVFIPVYFMQNFFLQSVGPEFELEQVIEINFFLKQYDGNKVILIIKLNLYLQKYTGSLID